MTRNKAENKNNNKFNLKNFKVYILGGACGVLAVLSIFMTIESAATGAEVADLQKKEAALLGQQQDLQEALVQNLSVGALQEKSTGMGFTKINNLVYVTEGIPVARLP